MLGINLLAMKSLRNVFNNDDGLTENKPLYNTSSEELGKNEKQFATVLDNESIIKNALSTNPEKGFEMLFIRYYKPLCNHAVRFLYSKEVAEDIVSEVFVNFWQKKHYENVTSSYRAYLYQAVRNSIYNYLKSEFGKKSNYGLYVENDLEKSQLDYETPQRILMFDELFKKIEESVASFPPQCQKVFLLSRFEGKKNREIAEELDIKIKTVEAHMMKALGLLKNCLTDYLK